MKLKLGILFFVVLLPGQVLLPMQDHMPVICEKKQQEKDFKQRSIDCLKAIWKPVAVIATGTIGFLAWKNGLFSNFFSNDDNKKAERQQFVDMNVKLYTLHKIAEEGDSLYANEQYKAEFNVLLESAKKDNVIIVQQGTVVANFDNFLKGKLSRKDMESINFDPISELRETQNGIFREYLVYKSTTNFTNDLKVLLDRIEKRNQLVLFLNDFNEFWFEKGMLKNAEDGLYLVFDESNQNLHVDIQNNSGNTIVIAGKNSRVGNIVQNIKN